mgnify:CR=1 FL=1
MKVYIRPKKLSGTIDVVPSKSYSHRAIIAASLADGVSEIKNVIFSNDILRTIDCCRAFGAEITICENSLTIKGSSEIKRVSNVINAGESGSTIRFMIPIMLVNPSEMTFCGENNLNHRPLDSYYRIFDEQNIKYHHPSDSYMPLKTNGGLKSGVYEVRGDISSQFITGLLFALPLLNGDSKIKITTNLESKSYIDLTLSVLKDFGIDIKRVENVFYIKGGQKYHSYEYTVEGDCSNAAFLDAFNFLGGKVEVTGLNPAIILLSLSVWGSLLGMIGLIIALPLTTLCLSYYRRFVIKEEAENHLKTEEE